MKKLPEHQEGSGNVFADLGLPNAPELQAKADLAVEISRTIAERGLTQAEAAELLGIDQPKVSALVRGRLTGFSMERLYRFLNALGRDVEIVVRAPRATYRDGTVKVVMADRKRSIAAKASKRSRRKTTS
jgi:predicted XRE-type DNA-binding protein